MEMAENPLLPLDLPPLPVPPPAPPDPSTRFPLRTLLLWLPATALLWFPLLGLTLGWHVFGFQEHGLALFSLWFYLTILAWMYVSAHRAGLSLRALLGPLPHADQWLDVGVAPALHLAFSGTLMLAAFSWLAQFAPHWLGKLLGNNKTFELGGTPVLAQWLLIAVLAPIVEELFFRGILLHRAVRHWGATRGLLATSLLFGALHMNPVGIFAFGLLLGVLYLRTRSLWVTTFAHLLNNTLPLLAMAAPHEPRGGVEPFPTALFARMLPMTTLLALAMAVAIAGMLRSRWPHADVSLPWAPPAA
jgi:hypothetical protein